MLARWSRTYKRLTAGGLFPFALTLGTIGISFAWVAYGYTRRYALPVQMAVAIYLCFLLLLGTAIAPGFRLTRERIERLLAAKDRRIPLLIGVWCSPYLLYCVGTADFRWDALLKLVTVAVVVLGIYTAFPATDEPRLTVQDVCVAIWLIGIVLSGQLRGIWNVPTNLDFMGRLFLINVASWCWLWVRKVPGLGYEFCFSGRVIKQAGVNFGYFAVIAIPASLGMHFTNWNPRWHGIVQFGLDYLEIFLFIALLEELLFRGFLQTLLSRTLGSWIAGQASVAVLFGLFHILHHPFPNWRYVALASVAGWFYGSAYRHGGNLMASSLMHAAVDTVWRTWFTAGGR